MVYLDSDEQVYCWYISNTKLRVNCDLTYINGRALYGFLEEPDYDMFEKYDLRLFFHGTMISAGHKVLSGGIR